VAFADGAAEDVPVAEVQAALHESLRLVVVSREGIRVPIAEGAELPLLQVQGGGLKSCSSRGAHVSRSICGYIRCRVQAARSDVMLFLRRNRNAPLICHCRSLGIESG